MVDGPSRPVGICHFWRCINSKCGLSEALSLQVYWALVVMSGPVFSGGCSRHPNWMALAKLSGKRSMWQPFHLRTYRTR